MLPELCSFSKDVSDLGIKVAPYKLRFLLHSLEETKILKFLKNERRFFVRKLFNRVKGMLREDFDVRPT